MSRALFGLLGGFGYLGWGISLHNKVSWIAPVLSVGLIGAGMTVGLTVSTAYLVDSFGAASASALTAMMTLRVSAEPSLRLMLTYPSTELRLLFGYVLGFTMAEQLFGTVGLCHDCWNTLCCWLADDPVSLGASWAMPYR